MIRFLKNFLLSPGFYSNGNRAVFISLNTLLLLGLNPLFLHIHGVSCIKAVCKPDKANHS